MRFLSSDAEVSSSDKESAKSSDRDSSSGKSGESSSDNESGESSHRATSSGKSRQSTDEEEEGFSSSDNIPLSELLSGTKVPSDSDSDSDNSGSTSDASTIILPSQPLPSEPDELDMTVQSPKKKQRVGRPKGAGQAAKT